MGKLNGTKSNCMLRCNHCSLSIQVVSNTGHTTKSPNSTAKVPLNNNQGVLVGPSKSPNIPKVIGKNGKALLSLEVMVKPKKQNFTNILKHVLLLLLLFLCLKTFIFPKH